MSDLPDGIIRTKEGVYVLRDDTHLSRWIELHGRIDIAENEIAHFKKYIPEGGTVIDAGASLGDHTATYAKLVGPTGHVLAFEPNPLAFECLRRNMEPYPWVEVFACGLYSHQKVVHFRIDPNAGASHIVGNDSMTDILATLLPLDHFLMEFDSPKFARLDFIHLDAEGLEIDILTGGEKLIQKFKPVIVLEVNAGCLGRDGRVETDVDQCLDRLSYRWEEAYPDHGPHMAQRDIIAFPK